jgi:hypothetical protein
MAQLEFVRNKVAHNRRANAADVAVVRTAHEQLANMIGPSRMLTLSSRCTHAKSISDMLINLNAECDLACEAMRAYQPIGELPSFESCRRGWWFDESYIGRPVDKVDAFMACVDEYRTLLRRRGTGHIIEQWTKDNAIPALHAAAVGQISAIQSDW